MAPQLLQELVLKLLQLGVPEETIEELVSVIGEIASPFIFGCNSDRLEIMTHGKSDRNTESPLKGRDKTKTTKNKHKFKVGDCELQKLPLARDRSHQVYSKCH
jgi:hypothetical protein